MKIRMSVREIVINDLFNVVQSDSSKISSEWDEKHREWRYCFLTKRFEVWVTFEAPSRLVFITAIRLKRNP
ncbi:MAG TPA: hypothetical protein VI895_09375 [Bdellovibrionota bacterium]|nr:hypothetical protein [Bdellovibrionota bacterium]